MRVYIPASKFVAANLALVRLFRESHCHGPLSYLEMTWEHIKDKEFNILSRHPKLLGNPCYHHRLSHVGLL